MQIQVYYRTGDSFHTEDTSTILDYEWSDLKIIEENILSIYEHNAFCEALNSWKLTEKKCTEIINKAKQKNWFVNSDVEDVSDIYVYCLNLKLDDGSTFRYFCDWCGYFETFYKAEITFNSEIYKYKAEKYFS